MFRSRIETHRLMWHARRIHRCIDSGASTDSVRESVAQTRRLIRRGAARSEITRALFPAVATAIAKHLGLELRVVQIAAALGLTQRCVVEMQTGEGKTVSGVPAAAFWACHGLGCLVVTANEYLAQRDRELLDGVYSQLGLSTGVVLREHDDEARKEQYRKDVVFSTPSEIGFDFLRDRLKLGPRSAFFADDQIESRKAGCVQHQRFAAVIDEADSVLIDDASTPLIIATEVAAGDEEQHMYGWAHNLAERLIVEHDFVIDRALLSVDLTVQGERKVQLSMRPAGLGKFSRERLSEQVERSLTAVHLLQRDHDYVVADGEVVLISRTTGRKLIGRKWQSGLHQAVEVKEALAIAPQTRTVASITIQNLFGGLENLSGMTGTATHAAREFRKFYQLRTVVIPTHQRCRRRVLHTRFTSESARVQQMVCNEVEALRSGGRPVLIGTTSVGHSEELSSALTEKGLAHVVLNARQDSQEAEVVSQAGRRDAITVATSMAGRGTDIMLTEEAKQLGGLHVIAVGLNDERRVDRQLVGRAARQGDPGSCRQIVSLDILLQDNRWTYALAKLAHGVTCGSCVPHLTVLAYRLHQRWAERKAFRKRLKLFEAERKRLDLMNETGLDNFIEGHRD